MSFRKFPLALAVSAALFSPSAFSADAGDDADALDTVVVTATRTAVTVDAALAPVEVIDRDAIQRSQASSLGQLLRGRAGINLSNQGGDGKLTSLFVRGAESDHVLVLVDGVRIGSATSGQAAFQDLPIALIDRVEIVRGPRSSLYGSDAIGGVIQIFTRRDGGPATFRFHVGAGSHGRREGGLGFGGGNDRGWFGFDAGLVTTDGIDACRGLADDVNFIYAGCFVNGQTDRDGYENRAVSVRGGVEIGDAVTLQAHALHVSGHNEYDGSFVDNSDIVQQAVGTQLHWKASDAFTLTVSAGSNKDSSDNFLGDAPKGFFSSRRDTASVQADFVPAEGQTITVGADWLRDRVDSDTPFDDSRRTDRAAFAQYQGRFGRQDVQFALRRDDNDQFGGKTTGNAAWGLGFGDGWRVTAGYGTAFKAPTFNELYYPFFGNPALRPEASRTAEAGLAWRGETVGVHLDEFETRVDDLIAYDASLGLPNNIDEARLRGAELRADGTLRGWNVNGAASWLDPENRAAGANRGKDLPRRARETARLDLDRAFGAVRIGLTGVAECARWDDVANSRRLGGFATLDLRAEYRLADAWTLQAGVANVFDRRYETASYYRQPDRTWTLALRFEPGW
ncbi:MAG: TonB-dependent vitamin B12 receptor [Lysobacteraceae bacterium]